MNSSGDFKLSADLEPLYRLTIKIIVHVLNLTCRANKEFFGRYLLTVLPEFTPQPESYFTFVNCGLSSFDKQSAIELLEKLWAAEFPDFNNRKSSKFGSQLDAKQLLYFKNDLFVLFEASYTCHSPKIVPAERSESYNG